MQQRDRSPERFILRKFELVDRLNDTLQYFHYWLDHILLLRVRKLESWINSGDTYERGFNKIVNNAWDRRLTIPKAENYLDVLVLLTCILNLLPQFPIYYLCFVVRFMKVKLNRTVFLCKVAKLYPDVPSLAFKIYRLLKMPEMFKIFNPNIASSFTSLMEHLDDSKPNHDPYGLAFDGIKYDARTTLENLPWEDANETDFIIGHLTAVDEILRAHDIHLNELAFPHILAILMFMLRNTTSIADVIAMTKNALAQGKVKLVDLENLHKKYNGFIALSKYAKFRKCTPAFSSDLLLIFQNKKEFVSWPESWGE